MPWQLHEAALTIKAPYVCDHITWKRLLPANEDIHVHAGALLRHDLIHQHSILRYPPEASQNKNLSRDKWR